MSASARPSAPVRRRLLLLLTLAALSPSALKAEQSAARIWNEQLLGAIRLNVPNPPAHARNLFQTAVAMYNAWAAYDATAIGYIYNEKVQPLPADVEAARRESISYAAYRILKKRFDPANPPPGLSLAKLETVNQNLDNKFTEMGFDKVNAQAATTVANHPAELGKRIGQAILSWGAVDGFANTTYPAPYNAAVNPNMATSPINLALSVLGTNGNFETNMPLGLGLPAGTNPNFWQPLALSVIVDQNGNVLPGGIQGYVGVQGLATAPFSLTRSDPLKPWIDTHGGPSRLSTPGNPSPTDAAYKDNAMDVLRKSAKLNDNTLVDFSPGAYGNNPIGTDDGTGFLPRNPLTGQPWAPNLVRRGDFFRVLAEFWADGPNSETPPGHWHVVANEVSDMPLLHKRIRGTGLVLNDLEWDVKVYFALSAATHDAACVAWSLKRYYSGARPITMIRYMGSKGQSSDPLGPSYHEQGLPLETGVVEVITGGANGTSAPGGKHEQIWDVNYNAWFPGNLYVGQIAVYSWPGEHPNNLPAPSIATNQSLVRWQLAKDWLPFQRKTFNTPAFPGFTSGHSTFSRAAAEALTLLTGSSMFPGGFHHHTVAANSMQIDLGPSAPVDLQWCSYYDAADQAGQSRRWGGIHPYEDDYVGRRTGAVAGKSAYALAEKYWTGEILNDTIQPAITMLPDGKVKVSWNANRGMYYKVRTSPDLITWVEEWPFAIATDTNGSWTDATPAAGEKFYQVVRSVSP